MSKAVTSAIHKIYLKKLNQKIKSIKNVSKGDENKIFIVKTDKGTSVIRIPKKGLPPFAGKHQALREYWASKAWSKLGIPVPKIIILDESRKFANFDYAIETYIPGKDLVEVKLSSKQSKAIMRQLGSYLKKMHAVRTKKYGLLVSEKIGEHRKWAEVVKPEINGALEDLREKKILPIGVIQQMRRYFKEREDVLDFNNPRLLHNDLNRENVLVQNRKISGIIDFGDAFSGDPMYDVARAYQGLYGLPNLDEFLGGYGKINKRRFNYYLLYHAYWALVFFSKEGAEDWIKRCKEMINIILSN